MSNILSKEEEVAKACRFWEHGTGGWAFRTVYQRYPFIKKMTTPPEVIASHQLTIRLPTDKVDKWGKPKPQRRRYDVGGVIKPHYKAYGEDLVTFGIEVKSSKRDFQTGRKGWSTSTTSILPFASLSPKRI